MMYVMYKTFKRFSTCTHFRFCRSHFNFFCFSSKAHVDEDENTVNDSDEVVYLQSRFYRISVIRSIAHFTHLGNKINLEFFFERIVMQLQGKLTGSPTCKEADMNEI